MGTRFDHDRAFGIGNFALQPRFSALCTSNDCDKQN
jgi:hypothetical protein